MRGGFSREIGASRQNAPEDLQRPSAFFFRLSRNTPMTTTVPIRILVWLENQLHEPPTRHCGDSSKAITCLMSGHSTSPKGRPGRMAMFLRRSGLWGEARTTGPWPKDFSPLRKGACLWFGRLLGRETGTRCGIVHGSARNGAARGATVVFCVCSIPGRFSRCLSKAHEKASEEWAGSPRRGIWRIPSSSTLEPTASGRSGKVCFGSVVSHRSGGFDFFLPMACACGKISHEPPTRQTRRSSATPLGQGRPSRRASAGWRLPGKSEGPARRARGAARRTCRRPGMGCRRLMV